MWYIRHYTFKFSVSITIIYHTALHFSHVNEYKGLFFFLETAQILATKRSWNMQSKYFDKFIRTATIRPISWCIFNSSGNNKSIWCVLEAEAYSEPCQTCKMERLAKIVNCYKLLTITGKSSILDVWLGTK